jgi:glucose/arabinose dehydrogenase
MKNRRYLLILLSLLALIAVAAYLVIRPFLPRPAGGNTDYQFVQIAAELNRPVYVTHAGDERLFVVEQDGIIRVIENGVVQAEPFLDVSTIVNTDGLERGLLGLAFHPDYANNGWFFINYTSLNADDTVARYTVSANNPNVAEPASAAEILRIEDPYPNHNAGQLAFGPDGYLYVGTGDGGSAGDPHGNGQNRQALLGKMLRLNVDGDLPYTIPDDNPYVGDDTIAPEIWAWGLRNPWRYSFDRLTGDLYIADVGQNQWEEINFQPANSSGGENYGWNVLEGSHAYSQQPAPENVVMPIAEYDHGQGCSVTGGYVYRGTLLPDLQGTYFFGDWCSGTVWTTRRDDAGNWQTGVQMNTGRQISSFGEDVHGELFLVDYSGNILRLEEKI